MVHLRSKKITAFTLLSYLKHLLTNLLCSLGVHFPSQPADHCWSGTVRQKVLPVCVGLLLAFFHFFFFLDPFFLGILSFQQQLFFLECQAPSFSSLNNLYGEEKCMGRLLIGGSVTCLFINWWI